MSFVFDPFAPEVHQDPFPLYKILRDDFPAYFSQPGNCWVLSRYDDVVTVALDPGTYSSAKGNIIDDSPQRAGATLGTTDPPRHDQLRKLVQAAFLNSNLQRLEAPARRRARQILSHARQSNRLDVINDYATPVVSGVLAELLGLPLDELGSVKQWVSDSLRRDPETRRSPPEADRARQCLTELMESVILDRRRRPQNDLVSGLVTARVDGESLDDREILMTSRTLLAAGVESTVSFFGNLALNLVQFPEARRALIAAPERIPDAIEESLRYNTSAQRFSRTLTCDVEHHGERMRCGDKVMIAFASANRDEREFPDADHYDIDRRPTQHLGFGHGKHYCIGAGFARLLTRAMLEELLALAPEYRLLGREETLVWLPSPTFRSMVSFPIAW